jgi:hypothetical protein
MLRWEFKGPRDPEAFSRRGQVHALLACAPMNQFLNPLLL